jgi:hypothetical protein
MVTAYVTREAENTEGRERLDMRKEEKRSRARLMGGTLHTNWSELTASSL